MQRHAESVSGNHAHGGELDGMQLGGYGEGECEAPDIPSPCVPC